MLVFGRRPSVPFYWFVLFGAFISGCKSDDEAQIALPNRSTAGGQALAVGALFPLDVMDSCRGGGKINFCSSESLASIDSVVVDDPTIVSALRLDELPFTGIESNAELVILGNAPGTTSLRLETTFDDGSHRDTEAEVTVAVANHVEAHVSCDERDAEAPFLVALDSDVAIELKLFHDEELLFGSHLGPLTGSGLARRDSTLKSNSFLWTSAGKAGSVTLTSPLEAEFELPFKRYASKQLRLDGLSLTRSLDTPERYEARLGLTATFQVDGRTPCTVPPLHLRSHTVEICGGEEHEAEWVAESYRNTRVRVFATGECKLSVAAEGGGAAELSFDVEVEAAPEPAEEMCANAECEPAPTECDEGYELGVAKDGCCVECQPVLDAKLCTEERVQWDELYASEYPKAVACTYDRDCSIVMLSGGCRNYCFLPVALELTAPFMNSISESFYTQCGHCAVRAPAPCGQPAQTYCESGRCQFVPVGDAGAP